MFWVQLGVGSQGWVEVGDGRGVGGEACVGLVVRELEPERGCGRCKGTGLCGGSCSTGSVYQRGIYDISYNSYDTSDPRYGQCLIANVPDTIRSCMHRSVGNPFSRHSNNTPRERPKMQPPTPHHLISFRNRRTAPPNPSAQVHVQQPRRRKRGKQQQHEQNIPKDLRPEEPSFRPFDDLLIDGLWRVVHDDDAFLVVDLSVDARVTDQVDDPFLAFGLREAEAGREISVRGKGNR